MKKLFLLVFLLCLSLGAYGQSLTTVTATITDPSGQTWIGGSVQAQYLRPQTAQGIIPKSNGVVIVENGAPLFTQLNNAGVFTLNLANLSTVTPAGGTWQFIICPNTLTFCNNTISVNVIGGSVDLSASLSSQISNPVVTPAVIMAQAYKDAEVASSPNGMWLDLILGAIKYKDAFNAIHTIGGSAGSLAIVQSGLTAEYRILPGDNPAALTDSSGNGNTGTGTTGTPPTVLASSGGLQCGGAGASLLPAALNSSRTIILFLNYQGTSNATQFHAPIIGNSLSTALTNGIVLQTKAGTGATVPGSLRFGSYSSGSIQVSNWWLQGTEMLTWSLATSGGDIVYINNNLIDSFMGNTVINSAGTQTAGTYQLCGAPSGTGTAQTTWMTGPIYYAAFYNRQLSNIEILQNYQAITAAMATRGVTVSTGSSSALNSFASDGDSITAGFGVTTAYPNAMTLNGTWTVNNPIIAGRYLIFNPTFGLSEAPYVIDPFITPQAAQNVVLNWLGINDIRAGVPTGTLTGALRSYVQSRKALGWKVFLGTYLSDGSGTCVYDAARDAVNTYLRSNWQAIGADSLVDFGADVNVGADGACLSAVYFQDLIHPTQTAVYNNITPVAQRAINRYFGNTNFSVATTYTTTALAPTATTAGSEATNTVTLTFGATPANCLVGNTISIVGTTPAGYSGAWTILTRSGTQVTYFANTASMGVITVQGTGVCASQQDADQYIILGGSATTPNFTLESCVGYTGQNLYIKNANTTSPWTLTAWAPASELIDGAASITMPTATSGNNPVVILQDQLISAAAAGCVWRRLQ